jgi:hypothetical protein
VDRHRGLPLEPLTPSPDGSSVVAEQDGGSGTALLLVVVIVIGVLFWFGANVMSAVASSCGGG